MAKRKKSPQNTKKVQQNITTVQKRRNVAQNIRNAADVIGDARKNVKNKICVRNICPYKLRKTLVGRVVIYED